jgi:hypothetical protein
VNDLKEPEVADATRRDPRIPPREQVVLRYVLDRFAAEQPDKPFVQAYPEGDVWTYVDLHARTRRWLPACGRSACARGTMSRPSCPTRSTLRSCGTA